MAFVLRQCDVTSLLVPVCYLMLEGRKDPSKLGLMYLCTFTLLKVRPARPVHPYITYIYFKEVLPKIHL